MADPQTPPAAEQADIELPNGVVLSGMGGDPDALRILFEERDAERRGEPAPAEEPPAEAPAATEPPKKPLRGQARFDALTREKEDEKRRADAAEAKAKDLEAKLAAASEPKAPPPAREEPTAPAVAAAPIARPKPTEAEVGTKYPTYADFIEDLSDWKAEQRVIAATASLKKELTESFDARSTAAIEAERATRSQADLVSQAFTRGRSVYPDFDAVIDAVNDILLPPAYQQAIMMASPHFEHVMYGLAKDRTKLEAILKIQNGVQLGVELAKFVPSAAVASPASTAPVVRATNAPAPVQPVGASARTTSVTSAELADHGDDFDSSGYREKRAKELGRKPVR